MNIIVLGRMLIDAVTTFKEGARCFFYKVMLMGHACPRCGGGLKMVTEGRCRCRACARELDPTLTFQRCHTCGGTPVLRVRRYQCSKCGADISSRFLFDRLVFNVEYFRTRMAESRQRNREQKERVRKMLAECRSQALDMPAAIDLKSVPGLLDALNSLATEGDVEFDIHSRNDFDMERYQTGIQAHIRDIPVSLDEIPHLIENTRKDRIWRFIAVIFMAHAGLIDIWQEGHDIMVMKREAH